VSKFLCITVRFLQPLSHGRGDGGEPEWPPSPLRVFQALVAAAAARWNERTRLDYAVPTLQWLAKQHAPTIVAAMGIASNVKYRLYVPDNVADKIAKSWRGGNVNASIADYKAEKDVRPTHLTGDAVHYLYPVPDTDIEFIKHKETLVTAARSITHLGWGIDMVAGNASEISEEVVQQLKGERWQPIAAPSLTQLRVPREGTLKALMEKHTVFLSRLSDDSFKPVPPLTVFDTVSYQRDTDSVPKPFVAFELRTPDFERFQPYATARRTPAVAGMVRNAVAALAQQMRPFGWTDADINTFVHGHTIDGCDRAQGKGADHRFSYLPLPSIEQRPAGVHVGAIRRILIAVPSIFRSAVVWAKVLSGQELSPIGETRPSALRLIDRPELSLQNDPNLKHYVGRSRVWSTVTPVVLPGYDDPDGIRKRLREKNPVKAMGDQEKKTQIAALERRVRGLLQKAFRHAGFSEEVIRVLELDYRNVGFRPGVELASRYVTPEKMTGPRYHVRVRFPHPVRGPLAVGAGRYRGLGLFAAESD
jgi:CRISPR-associated protein Csb2